MEEGTRTRHATQLRHFLQSHFRHDVWTLTLPEGSGHETYFASDGEHDLFIKLGAQPDRAVILSEAGLSPPVLAVGVLDDGTSVLVQQRFDGRQPSRSDYRDRLDDVTALMRAMHHNRQLLDILPLLPTESYAQTGLLAMERLRTRWSSYRERVPHVAEWVDSCLDRLTADLQGFGGEGLVASHNDFCRANLLLTPDGKLYVLDLEEMSREDPAHDLGAVLWWYYPPEMWPPFLRAAGYADTRELRERMRVRLAMHSLAISLPRANSFDRSDPEAFSRRLVDFRAVYEGRPNPEISSP
jgi:hypothetical protein